MEITFYGAAREVTGSMHLVTTASDDVLLDAGLFQGRRKESDRKNRAIPFDPSILTTIVLSHAHIDHAGRIPLLVREGFSGRVVCTRATADAAGCLLPDSGHIQESDADYLNYKTVRGALARMRAAGPGDGISGRDLKEIKRTLKRGRHELDREAIQSLIEEYGLAVVEPLYTQAEAEASLSAFDGVPYATPTAVGKNLTCTFYEAGHILGSAVCALRHAADGRDRTILYTGDIGRFGKPILRDPRLAFPEADRDVDLLVMESTYGDRLHEPVADSSERLARVIRETADRGGTVLVPSFAFGRTQELIYVLHRLYDAGAVPRLPVYIDSPLAIRLTRVFGEHPEVYDRDTHADFLEKGENPFHFGQLHFSQTVEDSMALMKEDRPHIVLASSGMCEAGRILHHLRYKIHDPRNTILIVGYMAENTLGRRILEQGLAWEAAGRPDPPPSMKFLNKQYPLRARVAQIGGFSAHADRDEMLRFLREGNLRVKRIALVHGEPSQSEAFAERLRAEGYDVKVPRRGERMRVG